MWWSPSRSAMDRCWPLMAPSTIHVTPSTHADGVTYRPWACTGPPAMPSHACVSGQGGSGDYFTLNRADWNARRPGHHTARGARAHPGTVRRGPHFACTAGACMRPHQCGGERGGLACGRIGWEGERGS